MRKVTSVLLPVGVFLTALALRIFQLGRQSFWNDEAGEVLAAVQPTLAGTVAILQGHVMAMPLDYFVARLAARVQLSETFMRLPPAVWGTLGVVLTYALARIVFDRLAPRRDEADGGEKRPGLSACFGPLAAAWIMAFSMYPIYYSQEVRFYAALFFFYTLACLLLFQSLNRPSFWRWAAFSVVMAIGAYFHPYVLLVVLNGAAWLVLVEGRGKGLFRKGAQLLAASAAAGLVFLPGYIYFADAGPQNHYWLEYNASFLEVVAQGFGWLRVEFRPGLAAAGPWEILTLALFLAGLAVVLWRRDKRLLALLLGAALQVGLIGLFNWARGYWFVYRQIVHLAAAPAMVGAAGMAWMVEWAAGRVKTFPRQKTALMLQGVFLLAVGLAAVPNLGLLYTHTKSNARPIVNALLETGQPGMVLVIPGYEEKIYRLYLREMYAAYEWDGKVAPSTWESLEADLAGQQGQPGPVFLVAPTGMDPAQREQLERLGFTPLVDPSTRWYGDRSLFVRPAHSTKDITGRKIWFTQPGR